MQDSGNDEYISGVCVMRVGVAGLMEGCLCGGTNDHQPEVDQQGRKCQNFVPLSFLLNNSKFQGKCLEKQSFFLPIDYIVLYFGKRNKNKQCS